MIHNYVFPAVVSVIIILAFVALIVDELRRK